MAARVDDGAQHRRERLCAILVTCDEHGLRLEQHTERAEAVRAQGVARRDEVDDRVREAEPRRELDRAGDVDQLDRARQQLARQPWIDRRDGRSGQIGRRLDRRLLGHRRLEAARAEPELQQLGDACAALAHEVEPGDAAVDDAVLHVLGDVGGANEQHLDRRVPAGERERPLARLLRAETGVLEQPKRRVAQTPLDRERDLQELARSSASL